MIRMGCSGLNAHLFQNYITDNPGVLVEIRTKTHSITFLHVHVMLSKGTIYKLLLAK